MEIEKYILGPVATNCYYVQKRTKALLIDPAFGSYKKILEKHAPEEVSIFLTHSHWDHIADLHLWKKHCRSEVWVHTLDAQNVEKPGADRLPSMLSFPGVKPDHLLQDQQELVILGAKAIVLHTPGHSPGGVCLYFPEEHLLFSGDTLFKGTIGNTSFPTSDREAMRDSLRKLGELPEDITVYPGHGPNTVLGQEAWIQRMKTP